jgi:hypothetical protein
MWSRSASPDPRNTPIISGDGRVFYLAGLLMVVALGGAAAWSARQRRELEPQREWSEQYTAPRQIETHWMLPALTLLGALLLVSRYDRWQDIIAAALLAGTGVFAAQTVRSTLTERDTGPTSPARLTHIIVTVGIAFVIFALVLLFRTRTLYAGPTIFVVGALLLLQAQDGIAALPIRRVVFALVGAVALAQATWALNSWPPSGWWTGGVLAAILLGYLLVVNAHLAGKLTRELALNSAGIAGVLLAVCAFMAW